MGVEGFGTREGNDRQKTLDAIKATLKEAIQWGDSVYDDNVRIARLFEKMDVTNKEEQNKLRDSLLEEIENETE